MLLIICILFKGISNIFCFKIFWTLFASWVFFFIFVFFFDFASLFSYSFPSAWNRHWQHFCDHANFQHNGFVIMDDHDDNNDAWSLHDDWDIDDHDDHDCCHDFTSENWMRRKALIALWQTVFHRLNCSFSESSSNPLELTKRFGQTMSHAGIEIFLWSYAYIDKKWVLEL